MTTILVHRDIMYADSRIMDDSGMFFSTTKIIRVGEAIVGCSGEAHIAHMFLQQLREGRLAHEFEPPAPPPKKRHWEFDALLLNPEGLWCFGPYFDIDKVEGLSYAIGSGAAAALGALHALRRCLETSTSPILAVQCACLVDGYSGLPVQWMQLGEFVIHTEY